ncbi:MAG: hypothetical protein J6D42_10585 [Clostridia bacterium]|nr:hypothetical protein [Clostridia bacterium]
MLNRKKTKISAFWLFYLGFIMILCVICIFGLLFTNSVLEDFESSQPYKVVENYLKKIENGEYSYPFVYSKFVQTDFAGSEECISVLRQRYENKDLTFLESSSHSGVDTVRYNIYGNGERLGYVILSISDKKTKYGFKTWKIESCEPFDFLGKYTVTIPNGYILYADGISVDEKYIIRTETVSEYPEINGIESPKYITYEIDGFIKEPIFTVTSILGEPYTQVFRDDQKSLIFSRKEINYRYMCDFLRRAMNEYIHVISLEKEMNNYLQYVLEGSEYAKVVENFNSSWTMYNPEILNSGLENFEILRYEEYTDTQILAEISFDYVVELQYSTETYHSNYKIILIKTENGWKIANMENI